MSQTQKALKCTKADYYMVETLVPLQPLLFQLISCSCHIITYLKPYSHSSVVRSNSNSCPSNIHKVTQSHSSCCMFAIANPQ